VAWPTWIRARGTGVVVRGVATWAAAGCSRGWPRRLWRAGGEAGEGLAASLAGFRREPGGGPAGVVGLAGVEGGEDALVADGEQAGQPERDRGQAREAAPAAGDAGGGGVLDGGEGPLGAGAPGVGTPVRRGWVVVFLAGLGALDAIGSPGRRDFGPPLERRGGGS
jgi:hypothetical protein